MKVRSQENDEWYRRTVFEKRLTVVQEAAAWLSKFNEAMNREDKGNLGNLAKDARAWYDGSRLLLYDKFPTSSSFVGLTNAAAICASGRDGTKIFWDNFVQMEKYVRKRGDFLAKYGESTGITSFRVVHNNWQIMLT
ncbi:MAG: hypothetical protein EXR51_06165 [Dehalococcoidia bacterium]|nr:hypothetical protein [Dehalococcoidia bacterium]